MKTNEFTSAKTRLADPEILARINGDFIFFRTLTVLLAFFCLVGLFFIFF